MLYVIVLNINFRYIARPPLLVNSSVVFLQFQANRQTVDRFEAAFAFHDGEYYLDTKTKEPRSQVCDLFRVERAPLI